MKKTIVFTIALIALVSVLSIAQTKTPVINDRQANQQARIGQGVKSGELTPGETAKLEKEQAKIRMDKKVAKADGNVTVAERRHIKKEQRKASRHIHRLKHNARKSTT